MGARHSGDAVLRRIPLAAARECFRPGVLERVELVSAIADESGFLGRHPPHVARGGDQRPDLIAGVSTVPAGGRTRQMWFNPAAFQNPADGLRGNVGRNTLSGPGTINIDLSLFKTFAITERWRIQLRTEAFNLLNHANFALGSDTGNTLNMNSATFGQINSTSTNARLIQAALRLRF
jgi:hypothetical protein